MNNEMHIDDLPLSPAQRARIVAALQHNASAVAGATLTGSVTVTGEGGTLVVPM